MAFRYNELLAHDETIRLLQIAPSTNLDSSVPLECSILKTRLEVAPVYTALSYTWGNDVATASLSIDGLSFMIRPNLHSALLALRYVSLKRILWVDAICINQDNAIEKEYQVGLMRKIYQRASNVTIWLNTYDDEIGEAFAFIRQLQGSNVVADVSGGAFEQKIAQRPWKTGNTLPIQGGNSRSLHVRHTFLTILTKIFAQDWWSRIWVIQEVAVSQLALIRCGHTSLPWMDLVRFLGRFPIQDMPRDVLELRYLRQSFQGIDAARQMVLNKLPIPLLSLLMRFRAFSSHDARDKVYALLGLAERDPMGILEHVLRSNYTTSIEYTCKATVQFCVTVNHSLDILSTAGQRIDKPDWPSWIPSWDLTHPPWQHSTSKPYFSLLGPDQIQSKSPYQASGHHPPIARLGSPDDERNLMEVQGLKIAKVIQVGRISSTKFFESNLAPWFYMLHIHFQDHNGQLSKAAAFWTNRAELRKEDPFSYEEESRRSHEEPKEVQPPNESSQQRQKPLMQATERNTSANTDTISTYGGAITETCYRTLTADRDATGSQSMPCLYLHHVLETQQAFLSQPLQGATSKASSVFQDLMIAIEQATNYRALFITEEGHIGLGPTTTKLGDEICVIPGCSVPLMLRSHDVLQDHRQGQSYLGTRLEAPSRGVSRRTHHRHHRLIGECYLHGFMDGEAVSKEGWEKDVRTFSLI
jgi:Heterokaryon incompatibility protein (HET)